MDVTIKMKSEKYRAMQDRLTEAIRASGKSTTALARAVKLSPSSISRYESHKQEPSLDAVILLCLALNLSPTYLLFGIGEKALHTPQQ